MRVVAGRLKGKPLTAPEGARTRPTSDRLRGSLFDILAHGLGDPVARARVVDLFAGSGALAIEALSRGADFALFIDEDASARGAIRDNCQRLGLNGQTRIFRRDATKLGPLERFEPFTLAFLDPPYGLGLGDHALTSLAEGGWLADGAICVIEERADVEVTAPDGFTVLDTRRQGLGAVTFLRWQGG